MSHNFYDSLRYLITANLTYSTAENTLFRENVCNHKKKLFANKLSINLYRAIWFSLIFREIHPQ